MLGPLIAGSILAARLFHQEFEWHDLPVIGLLVVLEGVLSIDNALVLGLLAKRVPKRLQGKALTYGLVGALVFRIIAIGTASVLLRWTVFKLLGGAYLVYVALKHFLFEKDEGDRVSTEVEPLAALTPSIDLSPPNSESPATRLHFWKTVLVIEITDIAFAVDSIVAAMALVGQQKSHDTGTHDKLWVVVTGGMLGVILMRFASMVFIKLLEKFPRFEVSAYLLVIVIGVKLLVDWGFNSPAHVRVDFHSPKTIEFWAFLLLMLGCFCLGFWRPKQEERAG